MKLTVYPAVALYESTSGADAVPAARRGNQREHSKAIYSNNKAIHNVNYRYNPPKATKEIPTELLKTLLVHISTKLQLACSIKRSVQVSEQSDSKFTFSFVAFGFDEQAVLKLIPEFDKLMMEHGWDSLSVCITKLDGSVERVDFTIQNTVRYSGMKYDLNKGLL